MENASTILWILQIYFRGKYMTSGGKKFPGHIFICLTFNRFTWFRNCT